MKARERQVLDAVADKVLSYQPQPKSEKAAKRKKRRAAKRRQQSRESSE